MIEVVFLCTPGHSLSQYCGLSVFCRFQSGWVCYCLYSFVLTVGDAACKSPAHAMNCKCLFSSSRASCSASRPEEVFGGTEKP